MLKMLTNRKMMIAAGLALAAFAVIITVVFAILGTMDSKKAAGPAGSVKAPEGVPEKMLETKSPEAASATQDVINEIVDSGAQVETISIPAGESAAENGEEAVPAKEMQIVSIVPGTNGIDLNTGDVVNTEGKKVDTSASAGTSDAPRLVSVSPDALPQSAVKLSLSASGFSPSEFTVNAGQAVVLSVTSEDQAHIVVFNDPILASVFIRLSKGQTKAITFNAPEKAGEYIFRCRVPGHEGRGETGKMIVK